MIVTALKLAVLRQGGIFLAYLILCTLVLDNHSGGADIAFTAFMVICFLAHLITLLIIVAVRRKSASPKQIVTEDYLVLLALGILFACFAGQYLSFMWWLTNKIG